MSDQDIHQETPQSGPVKLNILGREYEFQNMEEVQKMIEEAVQASFLEGQKEALRGVQTQTQTQTQGPGREVKGTEAVNAFSREKFLELLDKNPIEAWNYVDSVRFGIPAEHVPTAIRGTMQAVVAFLQDREVQRFLKMTPEFQPSEQNAMVINQYMAKLGVPFTAEGIRAAFDAAVREGAIKPRTREASGAQGTPTPPGIPQTWESTLQKTGLGMNIEEFAKLPAEKQREILFQASRKARGQP